MMIEENLPLVVSDNDSSDDESLPPVVDSPINIPLVVKNSKWKKILPVVIGGVAATVTAIATPFVLPVIGFGVAGITAGSYAASMMSAAAIANGGGIAAGSLVAVLQSAGVLGLGSAIIGGISAAAGAVTYIFTKK
jgi:hypothetical protein